MSVFDQVTADARSTTRTGHVSGSGQAILIEWRLRRVRREEVAVVQRVGMALLDRPTIEARVRAKYKLEDKAKTADDPEAAARKEIEELDGQAREARRTADEVVREKRRADAALVCLSVEAWRLLDPGDGHPLSEEWEPIRLSQDEPTNREAGVLSIDDLPAGAEAKLAEDVAGWLLGGQAGLDTLAAFRRRPGRAAGGAPAGEGVRGEALDPPTGG